MENILPTIVNKFRQVGIEINMVGGRINISKQNAIPLLRFFKIYTTDEIYIETVFLQEENFNTIVFSLEENFIKFEGIEKIINWFILNDKTVQNFENSKNLIETNLDNFIEYRPTKVLKEIQKKLNINKGKFKQIDSNKKLFESNEFSFLYIYKKHVEILEFKINNTIIERFQLKENLDETIQSINTHILKNKKLKKLIFYKQIINKFKVVFYNKLEHKK